MSATLTFIGHIATPYASLNDCPNNVQAEGPSCQIKVDNEYKPGLLGLTAGDSILVLYWLAEAQRDQIIQQGRKGASKGTFALRSPNRPNPIGAATLVIDEVTDGIISVKGLDCLNRTPLIDIKPAI